MDNTKHITVLLDRLVELIVNSEKSGNWFDATLGGGGHITKLSEQIKTGKLIATDLDAQAIQRYQTKLVASGWQKSERGFSKGDLEIILEQANFAAVAEICAKLKIEKLQGVYADLGFSTDELSSIPGLSFRNEDQKLDMRFVVEEGRLTAADYLSLANEAKLDELLSHGADIGFKQQQSLIREITNRRKLSRIDTVADLNSVIEKAVGKFDHAIFAQVYQALRIVVNGELESLEKFLVTSWGLLSPGGRFGIITFHSGEEKLVEQQWTNLVKEGKAKFVSSDAVSGSNYERPTVKELRSNLQARSAKLFVIEKLK